MKETINVFYLFFSVLFFSGAEIFAEAKDAVDPANATDPYRKKRIITFV